MVEAEVSQEKTHQPQMTVVGHSSYIHTHRHIHTRTNMHTHIHTSGNLLTDCIYCAGEETAPQPASGTADRGVKKPKGGGARSTLKATTNSSTLKERAGVRSRGLTGKGASTSNDSGGSLFLHAHTHIRTHTYTHTYTHTHTHTHAHAHTHTHACTRIHTSGNLLTDGIYFAGEETIPQPASGTAGRGGQGVEKPKRGGARTTLKVTTNLSTVKERAGVRSRGLTGKGTSTSNDSSGSLFLHAHAHTHTHTHIHTHTHMHMQTHTHTHAHAYTQVAICSLMVSIVQEKRLSLSLHQTPLAEEAKGLRSPNVVVPGPHSKSRPTHPL